MPVDDLILEVARETVRTWPDLALGTRTARPKAWGALAAHGIAALGERVGRSLTENERRNLWAALWQAAQEPGT
jgi:hypothetical protein